MKSDTTSGQLTRTTKQIKKSDKENIELENMKKQNLKLSGEVAILRQNLITIERENYILKEQKNNKLIRSLDKADNLKKELSLLQAENRIKENQLRAYKRPRSSSQTQKNSDTDIQTLSEESLDHVWVLKNISKEIIFSLFPFEYERLKILHDYFLKEFEVLLNDTNSIIKEMKKQKCCLLTFAKLLYIFSIKKEIFMYFFNDLFLLYSKSIDDMSKKNLIEIENEIYNILLLVDMSYLISFIEDKETMTVFSDYLDKTYSNINATFFYRRISKNRPFILNIILTKDRFNSLIKYHENNDTLDIFYDLVSTIPDDILKLYIDGFNIDKFKKCDLERVFKSDYISLDDV